MAQLLNEVVRLLNNHLEHSASKPLISLLIFSVSVPVLALMSGIMEEEERMTFIFFTLSITFLSVLLRKIGRELLPWLQPSTDTSELVCRIGEMAQSTILYLTFPLLCFQADRTTETAPPSLRSPQRFCEQTCDFYKTSLPASYCPTRSSW